MFCNFCEKFENSKWLPFLARQNFFENWHGYSAEIPCGSKISSKSLHLAQISRYKHFYVLQFLRKNSKIPNGRHFWWDKNFFKIGITCNSADIPCGSKISSKSLYLARFSRYKHFCVLQFLRKFQKFKMAAIFGETKIFWNWENYSAEISCGTKISSKSLYLARFLRYKHFCVLQFLRIFRKFKMAAILGETKFFENCENYSAEISCGSKISSKSLYLARFLRYKHFCVLQFLRIFRKFKMAAILGETKFFENCENYSAEISCGSKISSKSLYLARFLRYKHFCVLQFLRKVRKFKMAAILGETKIFWKLGKLLRRDTLWAKNFVEIALSSTIFEI